MYFKLLTKNMLCAGYLPGGKSTCNGDSGGPLVCKDGDHWFQYGITSWGKLGECGTPNYPPVFADIVRFLPWIEEKTGSQSSVLVYRMSLCNKQHRPIVNSNTARDLQYTVNYIQIVYVAAKATYIRLLHGKIGFLGGFSALAP